MIGGGKAKGSSSATGSQSWRELAGPSKRRVNSPQARRRRTLKVFRLGGLVLAIAMGIGLVFWGISSIRAREEPIQIATPSKPIEQVMFVTDGVLPNSWLGGVVKLEKGTSMMEVDIHAVKEALEAEPQVISASVERVFPSTLKISVFEHTPVLRIAVAGTDGKPEQRIVSREGTIYKGIGYPRTALSRLPFVLPYQHRDGSYQPMRGMDRVADLLQLARELEPKFFRTWKVVSLEHYSGDATMPGEVIEIRGAMVDRIIFGASGDFGQQLDRLKVIMDYVRSHGNPALKRIDLSLRGSAAVQFKSGRIGTF
jgi:cell division protein FtsQ